MKYAIAAALLAAGAASAGMIGDPVTSQLILSGGGTAWSTTGNSGVVGAGIEFIRTDSAGGFNMVVSLNVADSTLTLTQTNPSTSGFFNLGLIGFLITDNNQTFSAVTFLPGSTFPANEFIGSLVTPHTIEIDLKENQIPAGVTWTATWAVSFGQNTTPEPGTNALIGAGLIALVWFARRR